MNFSESDFYNHQLDFNQLIQEQAIPKDPRFLLNSAFQSPILAGFGVKFLYSPRPDDAVVLPPAGPRGSRAFFFAGGSMRSLTPLLLALLFVRPRRPPDPRDRTMPTRSWDCPLSRRLGSDPRRSTRQPPGFKDALRLNPKLNMSRYGIGRAHMALHQYDSAIAEYTACRDYILAQEGAKSRDRLTSIAHVKTG